MTDVLGHGPVAYYEQPLLITSLRPESARSLPVTSEEREFSASFELCIDAISTATMDSVRSYPTLAVTRSDSDATSPLQHIVAKLQLRREMQQHLRQTSLYERVRLQKRHKHAWRDKKNPDLQKPVWQSRITTNEFSNDGKPVEYVHAHVFPKPTSGVRKGFWKTMTSPTPGEQNLKTQQRKQSTTVYKRQYDPDKMNMSHVMKKLQLKNCHSAREERGETLGIDVQDLGRQSAPTTGRDVISASGLPRENGNDNCLNPYGHEYRNSLNYRQRYRNMLIEKALSERANPLSGQKPRQYKLPLLSVSSDDDREDVKGDEDPHAHAHAQIDFKGLCKSARPITDITTSRRTPRDETKLQIQSRSLQQDEQPLWSREYHVQGDRDTVTTGGRYNTTGNPMIKYDRIPAQPQQTTTTTTKQLQSKKMETSANEQSVSVQLLKPFDNDAQKYDLLYQQTYKLGLRQPPVTMTRQGLLTKEIDLTRTPTNTPAPEPTAHPETQIDNIITSDHHPTFHDRSENKDAYLLGNSAPKTKIKVYLPTVK